MMQTRAALFAWMGLTALCASFGATSAAAREVAPQVVPLWSGPAPGTVMTSGPETLTQVDLPGIGKVGVIVNVSTPTMTVVRPAAGKGNGSAMLVLPGGGFAALAWEHEGLEVARWLADRGFTAFVVKYRVGKMELPPGPAPKTAAEFLRLVLEPGRQVALSDVSQAMRLVRHDAARYGVAPDRIGMIGFSAGAITTMGILLEGDRNVRPDFAAPIYGMIAVDKAVPKDAPPLFIVATQDDETVPAEGSTKIFDLWTQAGRPAEMHVYEKGGHGFGARAKGLPVDAWLPALEAWLGSRDLLGKRKASAP